MRLGKKRSAWSRFPPDSEASVGFLRCVRYRSGYGTARAKRRAPRCWRGFLMDGIPVFPWACFDSRAGGGRRNPCAHPANKRRAANENAKRGNFSRLERGTRAHAYRRWKHGVYPRVRAALGALLCNSSRAARNQLDRAEKELSGGCGRVNSIFRFFCLSPYS